MAEMIQSVGRTPRQRTTLYEDATPERIATGLAAGELTEIINTPAKKYERKGGKKELLRPGLIDAVSVD
jgi:FO synthase